MRKGRHMVVSIEFESDTCYICKGATPNGKTVCFVMEDGSVRFVCPHHHGVKKFLDKKTLKVVEGKKKILADKEVPAEEELEDLFKGWTSVETSAVEMCGRCYAEGVELFDPNCEEKPETMTGLPIGQYHCPDCGAMVVAGVPHPKMCRTCLDRKHPDFDKIG